MKLSECSFLLGLIFTLTGLLIVPEFASGKLPTVATICAGVAFLVPGGYFMGGSEISENR